MKPESFPLILAVATMAVQGLLVILSKISTIQKVFFTAGVFFCSIWAIGIFFFLNVVNNSDLGILASVYYIAAAGIVWECIPLSYALIGKKPKQVITAAAVSLIPFLLLVFLVIMPPDSLIASTVIGRYNAVDLNYISYSIYTLYFVVYCAISCLVLFSGYKKAVNRLEKSRIQYILLSFILSLSFGGFFNLFLPWIGNYMWIWAGPVSLIVFVLVTYVATTKYRLFNLKLSLARFLTLSTLFVVFIIGYLLIITILYDDDNVDAVKILANVLITLVISIVAYLVYRVIVHATGRRFGGGLLKDNLIYQISLNVLHDTDIHKLLRSTEKVIASHMRVSKISLSIVDRTMSDIYSTKSQPTKATMQGLQQISSYMDKHAINMISTEEIDADGELFALLSGQDIAAIVRSADLSSADDMAIYVTVRRFPIRTYSDKEIDVLKTIAHIVRIAVDNAMHYEQVQNFNQELEKHVAEATADLREANSRLKRIDAAKDDFVSMASHQLRTPLTSIKGYIAMLLDGDFGHLSVEQKKILGESYVSSKRMAFIIDDFLDVSRLQLGKFELQKAPVRLDEILELEMSQFEMTVSMRKITIEYDIQSKLPELNLDANKLRQVMINMIDNAIYYSHEGDNIVVSMYEQRGQIIFTVKDHGIGVPRSEQRRLFTKFYRASNAREARPDGNGVGLYVARKVIIAHGGSLIFESAENVGSTFGFRLPIDPEKV